MASATDQSPRPSEARHQFGAFGGVFTPSILTIPGVIMYMRSSFVGGQAGIRLLHQVSSEEQRGPAMQDASSWALSFPQEGHEGDWHDNYQQMLGDMPPTVMVHSSGREDVFAWRRPQAADYAPLRVGGHSAGPDITTERGAE